jgi:hypothetical protein
MGFQLRDPVGKTGWTQGHRLRRFGRQSQVHERDWRRCRFQLQDNMFVHTFPRHSPQVNVHIAVREVIEEEGPIDMYGVLLICLTFLTHPLIHP